MKFTLSGVDFGVEKTGDAPSPVEIRMEKYGISARLPLDRDEAAALRDLLDDALNTSSLEMEQF